MLLPFAQYLRAFRVVVASNVEKGGPLAPSTEMAIELVRIRTAQQFPSLMPTLFPGDLAIKDKPYGTLAAMWAAFSSLKHNTSPAKNSGEFGPLPRHPNTLTLLLVVTLKRATPQFRQ